MTRTLVAVMLGITCVLSGCSAPSIYDGIYDKTTTASGYAVTAVESPAGFVAAGWTDAHERAAEDITLADLPAFAFGLTDPTQVLPPPFGTFYAPWKIFVTAVRAFPFVTWNTDNENTTQWTFAGGAHPGPLWYAVGPAIRDLDAYASPLQETVAADHTPVPGNNNMRAYWSKRMNSHVSNVRHAGYTLKYLLLNTNSDLPPYDDFFPDQMSRDKTTIHKTLDTFLFGFDWNDPYIN
ncbi:MAG TPA: hypothetical protein PKA37_13220 [Planctomycetota bacterium]|jgi:hypothetical protein|nr:hypothetical protein [Planctomycetota bacterium]